MISAGIVEIEFRGNEALSAERTWSYDRFFFVGQERIISFQAAGSLETARMFTIKERNGISFEYN